MRLSEYSVTWAQELHFMMMLSRDKLELDSPIDLDAVAPSLWSEDALGQDTLLRVLF